MSIAKDHIQVKSPEQLGRELSVIYGEIVVSVEIPKVIISSVLIPVAIDGRSGAAFTYRAQDGNLKCIVLPYMIVDCEEV